ncbi:hypothetical protein PQU92_10795 [Asticcacaulis sp. BYS171W]|uniref:Uncharacterized protein n=1 Tax=Asticcacaulis aquaticus TaxID=2984212 RepID=A0ABT5HWF4_9CAUL|nr:hypothetical protein [Asticcacaulis aquaticus]MDC7683766.1 hypothetical protein [Asticcacaulis aquaticus]
MTHLTIPLVPSDLIWVFGASQPLLARLSADFAAHGYRINDLNTARDPLLRAQGLRHDIRNLLRETLSETAFSARALGHDQFVIVGIGPTARRVVTVHRHFLSDHPELVLIYLKALADDGRDFSLDEARLSALQGIAGDRGEVRTLVSHALLPLLADVA